MFRLLKVLLLFSVLCVMFSFAVAADETTEPYGEVLVVDATADIGSGDLLQESNTLISVVGDTSDFDLLNVDFNRYAGYINAEGKAERLYTGNGNYAVVADGMKCSVVYDSVLGVARYYVDGRLCYNALGEYAISVQSGAVNDVVVGDLLKDVDLSSDRGLGSAEIVALQNHETGDKIRILAGVDTLWFSSVGVSVSVYENGELLKETDLSTFTVFESVTADQSVVSALTFGYSYFAVAEIDGINVGDSDYYILVRSYTEVDGERYYGDIAGVDVNKSLTSFDDNLKTVEYQADGMEINCSGNIYAYVTSSCDTEIRAFVDGEESFDIAVSKGRNLVLVATVEEGSHIIKTECGEGCAISSLFYFEGSCAHQIDVQAAWRINGDRFIAVCGLCGADVSFSEADAPEFLLTFETTVSEEVAEYTDYTVVAPDTYKIGNDTDGDKALVAGDEKYFIDVESSVLAKMRYYLVSFDLTVTSAGLRDMDISVLTLVSNMRGGDKVSGYKADYAYLLKYNTNNQVLATVDTNGDSGLLNSSNSISIEVGKQYRICAVIDTQARCAHLFVGNQYIGVSEKQLVDVSASNTSYPSFRFNDGGSCAPIYDNFKIVELK